MSFIVPSTILTPCILLDNFQDTKKNIIPKFITNNSLNICIFQKSFISACM